ncbi:MAG: hypothetical protein AB1801_20345, partial [Chloroflexota bacterium]
VENREEGAIFLSGFSININKWQYCMKFHSAVICIVFLVKRHKASSSGWLRFVYGYYTAPPVGFICIKRLERTGVPLAVQP